MSLAAEMFAIVPALGSANLSAAQSDLLVGKARWIRAAFEAHLPTIPTIVITRAAWPGAAGRAPAVDERLRADWVATLFKLVGRDGVPAAACCANVHGRLEPRPDACDARDPGSAAEADAVDPRRALGRAQAAFGSISGDTGSAIVLDAGDGGGEVIQFLSRDALTGAADAAPLPGKERITASSADRIAGRWIALPIATC